MQTLWPYACTFVSSLPCQVLPSSLQSLWKSRSIKLCVRKLALNFVKIGWVACLAFQITALGPNNHLSSLKKSSDNVVPRVCRKQGLPSPSAQMQSSLRHSVDNIVTTVWAFRQRKKKNFELESLNTYKKSINVSTALWFATGIFNNV